MIYRIEYTFLLLFFACSNTLQDQEVFITHYGARYHTAECPTVKNPQATLTLAQAELQGFTPCQVCKPETKLSSRDTAYEHRARIKKGFYGIESQALEKPLPTSIQCKGLTAKKLRCKHNTPNKNGYCYQHQSQALEE